MEKHSITRNLTTWTCSCGRSGVTIVPGAPTFECKPTAA